MTPSVILLSEKLYLVPYLEYNQLLRVNYYNESISEN